MKKNHIPKSLNNLKICAGKNCTNNGIKLLRIKYLQKEGWFCNNCIIELMREDLIVK